LKQSNTQTNMPTVNSKLPSNPVYTDQIVITLTLTELNKLLGNHEIQLKKLRRRYLAQSRLRLSVTKDLKEANEKIKQLKERVIWFQDRALSDFGKTSDEETSSDEEPEVLECMNCLSATNFADLQPPCPIYDCPDHKRLLCPRCVNMTCACGCAQKQPVKDSVCSDEECPGLPCGNRHVYCSACDCCETCGGCECLSMKQPVKDSDCSDEECASGKQPCSFCADTY
jgi:hypothetical protein